MSLVDWAIVVAYLVWVVWDGVRLSRNTNEVEGYFLASRSLPWWAVGLSVMATQLSAITMTSTTGQGYVDGMRFVQFYFVLPIAMHKAIGSRRATTRVEALLDRVGLLRLFGSPVTVMAERA